MRELVVEFDPDAVPLCDAPRTWREFDAVERLAASAKILLAGRVDDAREWKRKGYRTAAEQLADDAGTTVAAARSTLETSRRVAGRPKVEAALRNGEFSAPQAALVASAAEVAPEAPTTCWSWPAPRRSPDCERNVCVPRRR